MTKADIINKIVNETGLAKRDVAITVEAFMEEVRNSLAERKEDVFLRGFGSFIIKAPHFHFKIRSFSPVELIVVLYFYSYNRRIISFFPKTRYRTYNCRSKLYSHFIPPSFVLV